MNESMSLPKSIHDTSSSTSTLSGKASSRWDHMFNLLVAYKQREEHCNVVVSHKEDGKNLGKWLSEQRARRKKGILKIERIHQLEDLGVVWKLRSTLSTQRWDDMFILLTQYKVNNGHCNVRQKHKESGQNLGRWLDNQRRAHKKGKLNSNKRHQLQDLGVKRLG